MKKVLLIIGFLVSANLIIASDVSLSLPSIEVTSAAQNVDVNVHIDYMTANLIVGVQLSILYDQTKLSWLGTPAAPGPGVPYLHPGFTGFGSDYLWNTNFPGNLIMLWSDPTYNGFPAFAGENIITYRFAYNGTLLEGEHSPISFSLTYLLKDGGYTKIVNELTDENFSPYNFVGACGGLCPGEIWRAGGGPLVNEWQGDAILPLDPTWWGEPTNWSLNVVPTTGDVLIPGAKAPAVHIFGGPATCGAITIAPGGIMYVDATGSFTNNGIFTNDGQFIITSNGAGFSGSYIDNGPLSPLSTGTFEFDRNVWKVGGPEPQGDWHYISSPMAHTLVFPPLPPVPGTLVDGFENWDFLDYFALTWNAGAGLWANMGGGAPNCIPAAAAAIQGLNAWAINWDPTYTGQGCPNGTGNIIEMKGTFLNLQTGAFNAPAVTGGPGAGWNMYGNPYPSSLAVAGLNYAGFVPGVAMYSPVLDNYVYSTPGNGWAAGNIAPTQGFFVQAIGAPAFAVGNANKVHDLSVVWKEDVSNLLTLEATGNDRSDKLYVRIDMEGALPGFDNVGDFNKLFAEGMPQIYTVAEGNKLAVNALPATPSVPMEFTGTSGTYTIAAIETSEFANVVLEDLANGMETDLLAGSYTFEYSEGAVHNFVIHFTPLGTPELNANNINIWAADHNIYVQAPATTGDIVVYNLMGQEVLRTDIEAGLNVIPMTDVNTYYIVKVIGSDITETGKVFIK